MITTASLCCPRHAIQNHTLVQHYANCFFVPCNVMTAIFKGSIVGSLHERIFRSAMKKIYIYYIIIITYIVGAKTKVS